MLFDDEAYALKHVIHNCKQEVTRGIKNVSLSIHTSDLDNREIMHAIQ